MQRLELSPQYIIEAPEPNLETARRIAEIQVAGHLDTFVNRRHGVTTEWLESETAFWLDDDLLWERVKDMQEADGSYGILYLTARLARQNDTIGYIQGTRDEQEGFVENLYVEPLHRGAGIGGQLLEQFHDWVGSSMDKRLQVASYNDRAIHFYRGHGYSVEKSLWSHYLGKIPTLMMCRLGEKE